jgi:hypothetical protein
MLKYMAALEVGFRSVSLGILGPCLIPQHAVCTSLICEFVVPSLSRLFYHSAELYPSLFGLCEMMGQEFLSTTSGEGKTWTIYYKT